MTTDATPRTARERAGLAVIKPLGVDVAHIAVNAIESAGLAIVDAELHQALVEAVRGCDVVRRA